MHLTVLVWGFTAILGQLISIGAVALVWYRLILVVVVMAGVIAWKGLPFRQSGRDLATFSGVGVLVAVHWLLFYGCIKYAGVAVAVLCLSTVTFFTACLEPLVFRRRPLGFELVVGALVTLGVALLVRLETDTDWLGLAMGVGSALFSAGFGAINGSLARRTAPEVMTFWELGAALLVTSASFLLFPGTFVAPGALSMADLGWLSILAVGCTVLPWLWSLRVLQTLSPYTLALAVSLEPVYAMVLAWWVFPDAEQLPARFYAGAAVLVALVLVNTWWKGRATG
jgi:drug/metabolite transporter (DMT)-like permease